MTLREVNRVGEGQKNVPQLRFKGYEDAWEQRKLGEIVISEIKGSAKAEMIGGDTPYLETNYLNGGECLFVDSENNVDTDDVIVLWDGSQAGTVYHGFSGALGSTFKAYKTKCLGLFIFQQLKKNQQTIYDKYRTPNIPHVIKTFKDEYDVMLTSEKEQNEIGRYFQQIDNLITLHQRKYDALKSMKKTLLSKMFPKNGEDVPEIRFKEFTDAWEQRKLGEEVQIVMGQSPKGENYTDNPEDYILVQGNADMKDGKVFPRVWTTQVTKQAHKGDIILSVRAPVGDIGKTDYDVVIGRGVAAVKGNEFFYQLLGKLKLDGYWTKSSTGSTFDSINSNEIKNAKVTIPDTNEQLFIGDYFQGLDNLITLHQRKIEELKNMKKTLLQQIFV